MLFDGHQFLEKKNSYFTLITSKRDKYMTHEANNLLSHHLVRIEQTIHRSKNKHYVKNNIKEVKSHPIKFSNQKK